MTNQFTNTQINKLGERLRQGGLTADDIKMLDAYRRSFVPAYTASIQILRNKLGLEPTGRPAKSTSSIIEKLRREKSRLVTIQDIAGCRVVLSDGLTMAAILSFLPIHFPEAKIIDRRSNPSFGYRAVHYVAFVDGKPLEIQIRTQLQHLWAELSERLSDTDRAIKYGGGPPEVRTLLDTLSSSIARYEAIEEHMFTMDIQVLTGEKTPDELTSLKTDIRSLKVDLENSLKEIITTVGSWSQ